MTLDKHSTYGLVVLCLKKTTTDNHTVYLNTESVTISHHVPLFLPFKNTYVAVDWCCRSGAVRAYAGVIAVGFLAQGVLDWWECDAEKQMARYR